MGKARKRFAGRRWAMRSARRKLEAFLPGLFLLLLISAGTLALCPWGCTPRSQQQSLNLSARTIRVRLAGPVNQVTLRATQPLVYSCGDAAERRLDLPQNVPMPLIWTPAGWRIGGTTLGGGELILRPSAVGALAINDTAYRGQLRFVALGPAQFEAINDVDLDDYLKSVVSRELFPKWHEEAYRAQAIAARTYALYEKHVPREQPRSWDVLPDVRSQVYGGLNAETPKSVEAVEATRGLVLAYGSPGQERIFKAYFSSCCGGVSQSVADAFGDPEIEPLSGHSNGAWCSISPRYSWNVVLTREELARRLRAWGANRGNTFQNIASIRNVEIDGRSPNRRPLRYAITDARGMRYVLRAEDFRMAANTGSTEGTIFYSSFIESVVCDADRVRFIGGHGYGHGVGMCQWCTEARARAGVRHEDIVLASYPGARLIRAY